MPVSPQAYVVDTNVLIDLYTGGVLLDIDKVHYLNAEYCYGANFRQYRERWRSQALDELCRYLAEVTGDSVYDKLVEASF